MSSYLEITEASTTVTVETDDWKIVLDEADGDIKEFYTTGGGATNLAGSDGLFWSFYYDKDLGTSKYLYSSTNIAMTLLINDPNIIKVRFSGEWAAVSGMDFVIYYTIYPSGYIFIEYNLTNNTGGDIQFQYHLSHALQTSSDYTDSVLDGSGDTTPAYPTQFWLGHFKTSTWYIYVYTIYISNSDFYYNSIASDTDILTLRSLTEITFSDGESVKDIKCLYIGGNETDAAEIEADGIALKDDFIS